MLHAMLRAAAAAGGSYPDAVLADSPVAYWRLGETSGTVAVDEVGRHDGTYTGVTLGATGAISDGDTAASFGGADDRMVPADSAAFDVANLTIEAWVKTTGTRLFSIVGRDAAERSFQFRKIQSGELHFIPFVGGVYYSVTSTTVVHDGNWHHVAATYDGAAAKVYVDGSLEATDSSMSGNLDAGVAPTIGVRSNDDYFIGDIDEVAYYGTALSATRIAAHYNAA